MGRLARQPEGRGGARSESKHREAIYQQLSCEVMRSGRNLTTLSAAALRALSHPDVQQDPSLAARLRSFISEREQELRSQMNGVPISDGRGAEAVVGADRPRPAPVRVLEQSTQVMLVFERLRREFDQRVMQLDTARAQNVLERIESFRERNPQLISPASIERCRHDLACIHERRRQLDAQIAELTRQAVAAARVDDHVTAGQALRRLSELHSNQPNVLTETRLDEIRAEIARADDLRSHVDARKALHGREQAVAGELRSLANSIHTFQQHLKNTPPNTETFARAETEYRCAALVLGAYDADWLTQLILELDGLLEEADDADKASDQVGRFIQSVKKALQHLHDENKRVEAQLALLRPAPGPR